MISPRNQRIQSIAEDFASRHVRSPDIFLSRRNTDQERLQTLDIPPFDTLVAPDVVIHDRERDWLFLVDVATPRRHMNESRRAELEAHFAPSGRHLIFFSAFQDSIAFSRCAESIAWETEVWIAADRDHTIHFNGRRFLGPYPDEPAK